MLRNLSIGRKIVGLSVILLSVMLVGSIYSYIQTNRAHSASADLTRIVIPLAVRLNMIEKNALEQALVLERAIRHTTGDAARFRELNVEIESEVKAAQESMKAGLAAVSDLDDAVQLARIEPELEALRRDHAIYADAGFKLLDALAAEASGKGSGQKEIRLLEEQLAAQEDRQDETIDRLLQRLDVAEINGSTNVSRREDIAYAVAAESLGLATIAFLAGIALSALVTRRLVRPVRALIAGANEVTRGNLDVSVEIDTRDEVGQLSRAFQNMVVELRSKARIRETFGKYLDPRVVERLLGDGKADTGAGEKRVMTVFFSDLQGFSRISESLTAAGLVNLINSYLTLASEPIVRNEGVIDKYIGDSIMAFWGPPFYSAGDFARRACLAALAQHHQLAELKRNLPDILGIRRNLPDMHARIGLCTGELIVGSIGSNISKSFTVMGDTVNTASRLESANKQFGTRILMDGVTFDMVRGDMEAREIDLLGVAGKDDPVRVYELLGEKGKVEAARLELRDAFEAGLRAYRARDWDIAERFLVAAEAIDPEDKPVALYLERVRTYRANPPDAGWDAVWRLTEK